MTCLSCLLVVYSLFLSTAYCQRYIVPEATLEFLSPRGLKISIPDNDPGLSLVAFHININEEFENLAHGHFAQDVIKRKDGKWTYNAREIKVKQGDTIYYWIYAIVDNLGYHGLDRSYKVSQPNPHGGSPIVTPDVFPVPGQPSLCQKISETTHNGGKSRVCQRQVLLDKRFDSTDGWSHQVQIGGVQPDDEFVVFTKESSVVKVDDGKLVIRPSLLEDKYNDSFVRSGHLAVEGCTSSNPNYCSRQAQAYLILPPIMSARLNTKNSFSFCYGTVEIRAKLPRGDWIVPELWLEPVVGLPGERIVIALSRGNPGNSESNGRLLEAGVVGEYWSSVGKKTQDSLWSQDYHTFKLYWTPAKMEFSVDGQEIHRTFGTEVSTRLSFFDKEVYLTLGVHVAGGKDFPDSFQNKPWKNSDPKRFAKFWDSKDSWYTSWDQESALRVESIKITAL